MPIANNENAYFELTNEGPTFGKIPKYKILIEGDSWVSHPLLSNLSIQFDALGDDEFGILNLAYPGDTAGKIFHKNGRKLSRQLRKIDQLLYSARFGYEWDMIFISAAGNDIVGEEILEFVDDHGSGGRTGADLINRKFNAVLKQVIKNYENLLKVRKSSRINKQTPIITHVYSYLEPRLVGTKAFGAMFGKGWIKRYLDEKFIPQEDQGKIVRALLDRFHDTLKPLENKYDDFLVVDSRRVLSKQGKPDVDLWHDELHPTGKGFKKIAALIRKQATNAGIWPDSI